MRYKLQCFKYYTLYKRLFLPISFADSNLCLLMHCKMRLQEIQPFVDKKIVGEKINCLVSIWSNCILEDSVLCRGCLIQFPCK